MQLRPTVMLKCYRTRRRLGAYLDGALTDRESARAAAHLAVCGRCGTELESLRRLTGMIRTSLSAPPAPDWTGFWEGVRRGVEDAPAAAPSMVRPRPRLRFAMGTATAVALLVALVVWQGPRLLVTPTADAAISVSSADTDHPNGTVMIYSPPEKDLAVVWLFELD